ncbi:hypothetical protein ACFYWN_35930 [Streptomyces sp. NPDC002917]|uniref:hypothetical protein n=1 Tax=unclassified Streptomyces TaxID=2593676 RepID=UPI002E818894|nr:hypothetical protein [Streptomyces sp. NBC_00562]WTC77224.1 hypothetical protein OH719_04410 [Streptomyces sp. NBC_01653]WTD38260.1 hypothetical protein OHB03_42450 [Streptomyces sp. NBC_01643]WTD93637.1 hypothetical protein OG891_42450 [Streptomyces sp. NBC_01637]WTF25572.1 hypothetical protein OG955_04625 [Streptomyces sp. NBC_01602]WUC24594.1 hypothetical protein OHA33_40725 [Streptomyces sp. NBC_00562]
MSSAEPPTSEPADTPFEPARRAEDEPVPVGPPADPADIPATRSAGGADVVGEYEPL